MGQCIARRMRLCSKWAIGLAALAQCLSCTGSADVVAVRKAPPEPIEQQPVQLSLSGELELYDPSAIFAGDRYWLVSTGAGMPVRVTSDLERFDLLGDAVASLPEWAAEYVPKAEHFWS